MKTKLLVTSLILLLLTASCGNKSSKEDTINISGAFALYPLVVNWSEVYKAGHPEVSFNISAGGAGKGMSDALAQTIDLGMFSREISEEEFSRGVYHIGLCKDAVLPTISEENPYLKVLKERGLTRDEFKAIFIDGTITNWSDLEGITSDHPIEIYTRSDACGAAGTWAKYLGGTQEDLKGTGIHGDPALAAAVAKDEYGIGFNNTIYIYDIKSNKKQAGMEVIPIDLNNNGQIDPDENFYGDFTMILSAIAKEKYPSPPARELYFVSKGKPEKKACIEFIKWCLTDGQEYVKESGYVPISEEKIASYLKKLEK
ncbi:MAG: PstS family phosphate ABC transporter substrate-binding protein [Bacteroidales bacterium]